MRVSKPIEKERHIFKCKSCGKEIWQGVPEGPDMKYALAVEKEGGCQCSDCILAEATGGTR